MKKIIYAFCVALVLTSCYADKGNYDYTFDSLNTISAIKFAPEPIITGDDENRLYLFELPRPMVEGSVTKKIEVALEQTLPTNEENLEYTWVRSYNKNNKSVRDTVYTHGYVDVVLVTGENTQYDILLCIYDQSTTLASYFKIQVKTRLVYQNSLFVLHGNAAGQHKLGNVEAFGDAINILPDAYEAIYGPGKENSFANATHLGFVVSYNGASLWGVGTPGGSNIYNPYGLNVRYNSDVVNPASERPIQLSYVDYSGGETMSGRIATITTEGRMMISLINGSIPQFYYPGDFSEAPDHIQTADYQLAMVARNDDKFVAWDKKGSRFLCTNSYEQFNGISWDTTPEQARGKLTSKNPILDTHIDYSQLTGELALPGKESLYMHEGGQNTGNTSVFAYFRDPVTSSVYRYVLTPESGKDKSLKGDDKPSSDALYTITGAKMTNMTGVTASSPIVYWPMISEEMIYYATENKVYRYETFANRATLIYTGPVGSTISVLRFKSMDPAMVNYNFKDLIFYLCIGMNNGDQGVVAEIKLTNGGDRDVPYGESLYEGFGRILDLQFAHLYEL